MLAIAVAFFTTFAMIATIQLGWVRLRSLPVGRGVLWLAAAAVALVPAVAAVTQLLELPIQATLLGLWLPAFGAWALSTWIARRRPEGVTLDDPDAPAFERINAARAALDVGDLDAASEALESARDRARPRLAASVELWTRLVDEERQRRDGVRVSSGPTRNALSAELRRMQEERARPASPVTLVAIIVGIAVAVGVPAALARTEPPIFACAAAGMILATAEASPRATDVEDGALSHLTLVNPGEPAGTIVDAGLDLAAAAESRHDPAALEKLAMAGFVGGYHREWELLDGHRASAEIFRFNTASGAAQFHRAATEYACRFANVAFMGPNGETGLQIRYSSGDRIVEQLAWVDGPLRILVSRGFDEPPADQRLIIDLAQRASERLAVPHPAGSPIAP